MKTAKLGTAKRMIHATTAVLKGRVFYPKTVLRSECLKRAHWGWKYSPWQNKHQILAFRIAVQERLVIVKRNRQEATNSNLVRGKQKYWLYLVGTAKKMDVMVFFFKIALVISNCVICHKKKKSTNIEPLHPVPKCPNLNFMSSNMSRFLCLKTQPKACSYLSFLSHCNTWKAKLSAWDDAARGEAPGKAQRR